MREKQFLYIAPWPKWVGVLMVLAGLLAIRFGYRWITRRWQNAADSWGINRHGWYVRFSLYFEYIGFTAAVIALLVGGTAIIFRRVLIPE